MALPANGRIVVEKRPEECVETCPVLNLESASSNISLDLENCYSCCVVNVGVTIEHAGNIEPPKISQESIRFKYNVDNNIETPNLTVGGKNCRGVFYIPYDVSNLCSQFLLILYA